MSYRYMISIHAPTKGATSAASIIAFGCEFQSTHPRRVRLKIFQNQVYHYIFQSTHPRRVRHLQKRFGAKTPNISIHAPTKGATDKGRDYYYQDKISIHAPTKGATSNEKDGYYYEYISIHAPTKGATYDSYASWDLKDISIHAPTKGAT